LKNSKIIQPNLNVGLYQILKGNQSLKNQRVWKKIIFFQILKGNQSLKNQRVWKKIIFFQ